MTKPRLTRRELEKLVPAVKAERHTGRALLVMLPGYYLNSMGAPGKNDRNIYDDAMFLYSPKVFLAFNANTDPSSYRPRTKARQGVATLKAGEHLYKRGLHGISRGPGYPAFRPATPGERLPVWRDGDTDLNAFGVALNIHRGGYKTTSSDGCQTIHPDQWIEFYDAVDTEMSRLRQETIVLIKHGNE